MLVKAGLSTTQLFARWSSVHTYVSFPDRTDDLCWLPWAQCCPVACVGFTPLVDMRTAAMEILHHIVL